MVVETGCGANGLPYSIVSKPFIAKKAVMPMPCSRHRSSTSKFAV